VKLPSGHASLHGTFDKNKVCFCLQCGNDQNNPQNNFRSYRDGGKSVGFKREREAERDGVWRYLLCFTLQKQSITEHEGTLYTLHKWGAFVTFDFGTNLSREKRLAFL
jgi:hypothetical protein